MVQRTTFLRVQRTLIVSQKVPFSEDGQVARVVNAPIFSSVAGTPVLLRGKVDFIQDETEGTSYLGYCSLEEVYVQWLSVGESRFALVLSNCKESSVFYFN